MSFHHCYHGNVRYSSCPSLYCVSTTYIAYKLCVRGKGGWWYANGLKVMATTELVSGQFSYFVHRPTSTFRMLTILGGTPHVNPHLCQARVNISNLRCGLKRCLNKFVRQIYLPLVAAWFLPNLEYPWRALSTCGSVATFS